MANSPDVDGRWYLLLVWLCTCSHQRRHWEIYCRGQTCHGWDIQARLPQKPQSGLELPHMHVQFISRGTEGLPRGGLFLHSEHMRKKSGCNNAATAALANFSLVGVRQFKKPSRYEACRKLVFKFLSIGDTVGPLERDEFSFHQKILFYFCVR